MFLPGFHVATKLLYRGWEKVISVPFFTFTCRVYLAMWGARVGGGVRVFGLIRVRNFGSLKVGKNVEMRSGFSNAVGGDRKFSMWIAPQGAIEIGDGCKLSNSTLVSFSSIKILSDTFIGGGCDIYDTDFHPLRPEDRRDPSIPGKHSPIAIGPRAFVGAHCLILKGVHIGEGAVVAAGSVVTKSVPPFEIWGGRPARFIRKIEKE